MKEAIFFDLDGTLLPLDMEEFLDKYFSLLTAEFSDLEEPEILIKKLMRATEEMMKNDGSKSNRDLFVDSFFRQVDVNNEEEVMNRFESFYREKFPLLEEEFGGNSRAAGLIKELQNDYCLVLATNPLFPEIAVIERMKWAGLTRDDFDYITCYENMHYCKPNPDFFAELLDYLQLSGEQCIMVGNDLQEDMVAAELGFTTYLVEDYLIDRGRPRYRVDWQGTFNELREKML